MFEHFDPRAHQCVSLASAEARRLGHDEIGTVHLLLGVAAVDPDLIGVEIEAVRASVVALEGSAPAQGDEMMPFTAEGKAALEGANGEALRRGHTIIDPAHLLLALLDAGGGATRALRESGAIPGEVRERADAVAGSAPAPPPGGVRAPTDHEQALRDGDPVMVALGTDRHPIGDLGNPSVDARLLELMLVNETPAASLLRGHGIDEARLREVFGQSEQRR